MHADCFAIANWWGIDVHMELYMWHAGSVKPHYSLKLFAGKACTAAPAGLQQPCVIFQTSTAVSRRHARADASRQGAA